MKRASVYIILFLIAGTFFFHSSSAQSGRSSDALAFASFYSNDSLPAPGRFYICRADQSRLRPFVKDGTIQIERTLAAKVQVIRLSREGLLPQFAAVCDWINPASDIWKLSPGLSVLLDKNAVSFPASFFVNVRRRDEFLSRKDRPQIAIETAANAETLVLRLQSGKEFRKMLADTDIVFIASYNPPREELQINDLDLGVNKINRLHNDLPGLGGKNINISIKENSADPNDIDYAARYLTNPLAAANTTDHAAIMATMIAGAGNSWYLGRGVADAAQITSSDFANLLPDTDDNYQQFHISVQNHSYGVGIENFYGADAAGFDAAALRHDSLLFVFSAGNNGNLSATSGDYADLTGVANLTGSFKMAKNIITVGAVDSFLSVAPLSSRGPAFDGRVKPELVAYGEDGTSGAAALVSGTAAVLQQAYKTANAGQLPPAPLVKAILLNSADELNKPGPNYKSGYGNLNAYEAAQDLLEKNFFMGTVVNGGIARFSLQVPAHTGRLKVMLVWNDEPASANSYKALVNDLDLELNLPATGEAWQPWVLNPAPDIESLTSAPTRKRDSLNNIEQVTLDAPAAGLYQISIKGFHVASAQQAFYIAYQLERANNFNWDFPAAADNIFPATGNLIRFSTDRDTIGRLSYSIDAGINWHLIDDSVNTATPYFSWQAPDTNALGILKMQIGTEEFTSDTFTISKKPDLQLGFNCTDSVLWYWAKLRGVNKYQVLGLTGAYLQELAVTADTQFVFNKSALPYLDYAIAPVIDGKTGVKSYTTDYTTQGVDCYVNNFLADLQNEEVNIRLSLGTDYLLKRIVFEKWEQGRFIDWLSFSATNKLEYLAKDTDLKKGLITYRARLELRDGRVVYSQPASVFYFDKVATVIYPNPVLQGGNLHFQFSELQNQRVKIMDAAGRAVYNKQMDDLSVVLPANFSKGLYFISVSNPETNHTQVFKLVIY